MGAEAEANMSKYTVSFRHGIRYSELLQRQKRICPIYGSVTDI